MEKSRPSSFKIASSLQVVLWLQGLYSPIALRSKHWKRVCIIPMAYQRIESWADTFGCSI